MQAVWVFIGSNVFMVKTIFKKLMKSKLSIAVTFSSVMLAFLLSLHRDLFEGLPIAAKGGIFLVIFVGSYLFFISEADHIYKKKQDEKATKTLNKENKSKV